MISCQQIPNKKELLILISNIVKTTIRYPIQNLDINLLQGIKTSRNHPLTWNPKSSKLSVQSKIIWNKTISRVINFRKLLQSLWTRIYMKMISIRRPIIRHSSTLIIKTQCQLKTKASMIAVRHHSRERISKNKLITTKFKIISTSKWIKWVLIMKDTKILTCKINCEILKQAKNLIIIPKVMLRHSVKAVYV